MPRTSPALLDEREEELNTGGKEMIIWNMMLCNIRYEYIRYELTMNEYTKCILRSASLRRSIKCLLEILND